MSTILWIILGIVAAIVFWLIAVYNGLIKFKNRTNEAWSDIDVQLKRRYDLIPNLVNTVKGYAQHEMELFEKVTRARTAAMGAQAPVEKAQAENMLTGALKSLFAVAENYPDLKANQNFLELQKELSDTENKIQAARRFYNGNVRDFNIKIQVFPNNIVAGMLGFKKHDFFETAGEGEREPVKVEF
ncbi:MAG: LemA family protein [Patescibacteria group bacterium]